MSRNLSAARGVALPAVPDYIHVTRFKFLYPISPTDLISRLMVEFCDGGRPF